jgi:AbrB family looped-hinge helix DNA binding protein
VVLPWGNPPRGSPQPFGCGLFRFRGTADLAEILIFSNTEIMTKTISVSERGTLTLPKEARTSLGISQGGQLIIQMSEEGIVTLRAGAIMPLEIYSKARLAEFQQMNEVPLAAGKLRWNKGASRKR